MDCRKLLQPAMAQKIIRDPQHEQFQALFHCINSLEGNFVKWVLRNYSSYYNKEKLLEDARDAFRIAVFELYRKARRKGFKFTASVKTFLFQIALNQMRSMLRKQKHAYISIYAKEIEEVIIDDPPAKKQQETVEERERLVRSAIMHLSKTQVKIILLKFFNHMKSKQIAQALDVTVGNIDNHLSKAYKDLRNMLKDKLDFEC
jgi:RNA polymerase sigma factor (sigma-70 family)